MLTHVNTTGLQETIALVGAATVVHHEACDISDEQAVSAFADRVLAIGPVTSS